MRERQLLLPLASAACLVLAVRPIPAFAAPAAAPCVGGEAETQTKSAVDDGEIRWTDNTSYDDARKFAISTWQYTGSKIKIVADSAITSNDLEFKDGNLGTGANSAGPLRAAWLDRCHRLRHLQQAKARGRIEEPPPVRCAPRARARPRAVPQQEPHGHLAPVEGGTGPRVRDHMDPGHRQGLWG
ncbi:hypothetical protein [Streptomyces sp. NPDC056549]|uniref:hypothetical protein n=1 Tax=Streptomyces sp. NPDC056549 TaxID=3345864 RepID=UPI00367BC682